MALGRVAKLEAQRSRRAAIDLLVNLKSKSKINPNYHDEIKKVRTFVNHLDYCVKGLQLIDSLIPNEKQRFYDFLADTKKYGFNEESLLSVYQSLLLHNFLLIYAQTENILLAMLKGAKYGQKNKETITGKEDLGRLITIIGQIYPHQRLRDFIDTQFRNSLAHGFYYVKNDQLFYYRDGSLSQQERLELHELLIKFIKMKLFTVALIDAVTYTDWH